MLEKIKKIIDDWGHETFFKGDSLNEDDLYERISWLYSSKMENTPKILILDSPLGCQLELNKIEGKDLRKNLVDPIEFDVWEKIEGRMHKLIWTNAWCKSLPIFKTARNMARLRALGRTIKQNIRYDLMGRKIRFYRFSEDNLLYRYSKIAFYEFLTNTYFDESKNIRVSLSESYIEKGDYIKNYTAFLRTGCFVSLFFKKLALISRRPRHIRFNSSRQLHCDGNAAIEWRDGWKQYYLNGVQVPEEVAVPPSENVDPQLILSANNINVRREIVRKIGIDRAIQKLGGRVIDSWNGYELITIDIPVMRIRPVYLKMRNPSIGTYHVEGVPPRIRTCKEALSWRVGGLKWKPEQLT